MALPNSNISVAMVKAELGAATNYVGELCIHPNVNKWSRWKPVRYDKPAPITVSELSTTRGGLLIQEFDTQFELIDFYRNNPNYTFEYLKPRGGNVTPFEHFRLTDFGGYDADAFRWYILGGKRDTYFASEVEAQIFAQTQGVNIENNLTWSTLDMLDHYFGALFVRQGSTSNIKVALSNIPFSNTAVSAYLANVPIQGLTVGNYDVYAFIYRNEAGSPPQVKYIPIDGGSLGTATMYASRLTLTGGGTTSVDSPYYRVDWNLQFTNNDVTTATLTNVVVAARYRDSDPWTPLVSGEVSESLGTISVPGGGVINRSGTFRNTLHDLPTKGNVAYLQVDNGSDAALRRTINLTTV